MKVMPTIFFRMLSILAAAAKTADRIDYWVSRRVLEYWGVPHPSQLKLDPGRDRLDMQLEAQKQE